MDAFSYTMIQIYYASVSDPSLEQSLYLIIPGIFIEYLRYPIIRISGSLRSYMLTLTFNLAHMQNHVLYTFALYHMSTCIHGADRHS